MILRSRLKHLVEIPLIVSAGALIKVFHDDMIGGPLDSVSDGVSSYVGGGTWS